MKEEKSRDWSRPFLTPLSAAGNDDFVTAAALIAREENDSSAKRTKFTVKKESAISRKLAGVGSTSRRDWWRASLCFSFLRIVTNVSETINFFSYFSSYICIFRNIYTVIFIFCCCFNIHWVTLTLHIVKLYTQLFRPTEATQRGRGVSWFNRNRFATYFIVCPNFSIGIIFSSDDSLRRSLHPRTFIHLIYLFCIFFVCSQVFLIFWSL